jgi:hypothetical protein
MHYVMFDYVCILTTFLTYLLLCFLFQDAILDQSSHTTNSNPAEVTFHHDDPSVTVPQGAAQDNTANQIATMSVAIADLTKLLTIFGERLVQIEKRDCDRQTHHPASATSSPALKKTKTDAPSIPESSKLYQTNLRVMFALMSTDDDDNNDYKLPKLTKDCIELLNQTDSVSFSNTWRSIHHRIRHRLQNKPLALAQRVSSHFIASTQLVKKILSGHMFSLPLGRLSNPNVWKNDWSLAHFASPVDTQEFQAFLQQNQAEENSDLQYSSDSIHATKKTFTLFIQGYYDQNVDTILQCVANFIVVAACLVHIPSPWKSHADNPALVNYFLRLTEDLMKEDNKAALAHTAVKYPHLYFTIFGYFQDILGEVGLQLSIGEASRFAKSIDNPEVAGLSSNLFAQVEKQANSSIDGITALVHNQTPPVHAPLSFEKLHPPAIKPPTSDVENHVTGAKGNKRHDNSHLDKTAGALAQAVARALAPGKGHHALPNAGRKTNPNDFKDPKGDWLELGQDAVPNNFFPGPPNVRFCLHHALKGFRCNMPKPCKYGHMALADFTPEQKAILESHLMTKNKDAVLFSFTK